MSFKNIYIIAKYQIKCKFKTIIIWTCAILALLTMYMSLFPMIKEQFLDVFNSLPSELMSAFGMLGDGDLSNYNEYFAMIFNIIMIALGAFCIVNSAGLVHDEEFSGSIEFLYAQPVSRLEIILAKFIAVILQIFIIFLGCLLIATTIGGIVANDTFKILDVLKICSLSLLNIVLFTSLGCFVACFIQKDKKAMGLALAVYFAFYILGYFSTLGLDFLSWLTWLSPLSYLSCSNILHSTKLLFSIPFSLICSVLLLALSIKVYNKKDLQ